VDEDHVHAIFHLDVLTVTLQKREAPRTKAITVNFRDKAEVELSAAASAILSHARETFGSKEKADRWLSQTNVFTHGLAPMEILKDRPDLHSLVEHELGRIDHGIF
jgi:uncharacterized protein (DUF2384 family)